MAVFSTWKNGGKIQEKSRKNPGVLAMFGFGMGGVVIKIGNVNMELKMSWIAGYSQ